VRLRHGKRSRRSCAAIQVFTRLFTPDPPTIVCNRLRGVVRFLSGHPSTQALRRDVTTALAKLPYSRRMTSRIETIGDVWVYWHCQDMYDVSRVCNLSPGGLFLSTPVPSPLGAKARLDFLVQEGQIRAEAVVRHLVPGGGLGLKFTAITDKDCPQLSALLNRIRTLSSTPKIPSFSARSR
jgi:PilZ domain